VYSLVSDALAAGAIRAPGAAVIEARRHACAVLVANMMAARKEGLIVPWHDVDRPSRYTRVARRGFEKVVEALQGLKLVRVVRQGRETGGTRANEARPTNTLLAMLAGCTVKDCALDPMSEIVVLKDRLGEDGSPMARSSYVDYADTEYTETVREQVRIINGHLAGRVVHPRFGGNHALRRYYCRGSFDHGGRLFGHWGQSLKRTERSDLLIDDAPAVAIDFPAMFARLLYATEGACAPAGDLYDFPGTGWHRAGVKRVFNAILCRERASNRFPMGIRGQGWFPAGARFSEVRDALYARFPALERAANTGQGLRLMRAESDILVEACLWLVDRGIAFVPIHDALLVSAFEAGRAQFAMWRAFKLITGVELAPGAEPVVTPCSGIAGAVLQSQHLFGRAVGKPVETPLSAVEVL
jgi:hypothetical protein